MTDENALLGTVEPPQHDVCGDDVPEDIKIAVESMPEGYGQDEYDAEQDDDA